MSCFTNAKWIWNSLDFSSDEHVDFFTVFNYDKEDGAVFLNVSADSDYGVYINGAFVEFGQYPDYPHYKVYDSIDISEYLVEGSNSLAFEVWYYGNNCSTNIDDGPGLIFSLCASGKTLAQSDESTLSRISPVYRSNECVLITGQLGYTYHYDASAEDSSACDRKLTACGTFSASVELSPKKATPSIVRPIKRLCLGEPVKGKLIKSDFDGKYRYLFDFGREEVGVFRLRCTSAAEQKIELCYGEHIADGWVRERIHQRRFIIDYTAKRGDNDYFGYLRRLGLRYAELRCQSPLEDITLEIIPRYYPLTAQPFDCDDELVKRIYALSSRTLELCLHDHYEDCPWREQAMYVLDSRNQMLCGYYAFKEFDFPRSALKLMAMDRRSDGMMNITYPGASGLVIPSFALHFFLAVKEYGDHSGDWDFVGEIFFKLREVIEAFIARIDEKTKLISVFGEACYWNFYEWERGLDGVIGKVDEERPDLIINELLSCALQNMQYICDKLGVKASYKDIATEINAAINKYFYSQTKRLYGMFSSEDGLYTELGQSLAILCGAAIGEVTDCICLSLVNESSPLVKTSLSMKGFKYDALLKADADAFSSFVIDDIKRIYSKMLDADATSVWETEDGEKAFDRAGSLCHGWSALPIYYFHKLLKKG